jgi:hypothetical protein
MNAALQKPACGRSAMDANSFARCRIAYTYVIVGPATAIAF